MEEILYLIFSLVSMIVSIIGMIIFFGIFVGLFILWIMMLIDVIQRKFKKDDEKIIWILVLALTGYIGAIIYYFVIKRKDKKKKGR